MPEAPARLQPGEVAGKVAGRSLLLWRRLSQLASLALLGQWSFYGIFRCPFLVPYVSCESCPVITCHGRLLSLFWGFWLAMPLLALFFGRAFCGWVCPGGLVSQVLGKLIPRRLHRDRAGRRLGPYLAYLALALALLVWLVMGQPRLAIPIRVGPFFQAVALTFQHATPFWLARSLVVLALLLLGLVVANAWCRLVCPTGGALELVKRFSLYKVYKTGACNHCDRCLELCEMSTRPQEAACTNCGDCLGCCPQGAIKLGRPGREASRAAG